MNPVRTTSTRLGSRALKWWSVTMLIALFVAHVSAAAAQAPVGSGFTVTAGDLSFILKQIKIAERHAATLTPANPCGTLVGPDVNQIPDRLTSYGLRTVDGSCNNLFPGRETFAAADVVFPRHTTPVFRDADPITASFPVGPIGPTSYKQKTGNVVDSQPRVISNLIVDQTSTNPAAIAAAEFPIRSQGNPGLFPCTTDPDPTALPDPIVGVPTGCVPSHKTLFIPNVTTDVGLSPPYNSLFTFFGQFFDHGVDQTVKSGATVFVPLKADDPLITLGPDGKAGTGDEVPLNQAFMVLTRAQNQPGPDGILGNADDIQDATNTDSPWVDQSQTYTSHPSHQVFLREYDLVGGRPVSTGKFLSGQVRTATSDGGISTWASVKAQAATKLGLQLADIDVLNIPMLAADPYGNFIPGPARGLPQYVTTSGLVEGNIASPVPVPANVRHFDTPFLTDIAHNADPSPQDTDNNPGTPPVLPVPDGDNTIQTNFLLQPPGTYDDELLNAHFSCGDGRCNENIALSAIHQIFHSEHDRLVDYYTNPTDGVLTRPENAALLADFQAVNPTSPDPLTKTFTYGERLFQAARFVTEMEYQHLVFEEFARKVQPAVRPFHVYSPDINPAIHAEFAHAVYRFGHSMLDDDVARTNPDGSDNSLPLLTAFLNPPEFFNGHSFGTLTAEQAAGAIVMGSSDQVGNELDEFVTETLRNNLLGLPLDLPTINMTRAREAGIPPLNDVRRQIFARTNDGQLAPYTDWSDFGQHLKHPERLINFVAAYGLHPSITGATTLVAKRDAARAIVNPLITDVPPADAADFMFSTGTWANTPTGLDNVDLWVGGLAEITNLFGGLLGSTFNYVFQSQLEDLQDGDRLYYLNRTPGMNLRTQLEGNSFSELIERNTDGTNTLKADAFSTADCKFQLSTLAGTPAGFTSFGSTVANDPATECDETALLLRAPNGTISYRAVNTVDPVGINGQSVYNGTPGVDRITGGNDNDTILGNDGNDIIQGNGGDDFSIGGNGNDIITDLSGADVEKGGPGNDALDGGIGDDIFMGGDGSDFINGGANDNEAFAGPGNDFIIAGQGADAVQGDGGDDWIQGGSGQDLLIGDHSAPFFDDPAESAPGNDVFVGQVGENDYDAEGGDDLMAQNAAIDRNAGAGGWDWAIHQYDTVGADDDMEINQQLVGVPIQIVVNRDRWQETEADSGSAFNDIIRGDDLIPSANGGAGFSGCDALDAAGVARITGLNTLVTPAMLTVPSAPIAAASASGFCPLVGNVWGEGNILLGGGGSDTIVGRGGDDIIDGDRSLRARISVRTGPNGTGTELGTTDLMEGLATSGNFGAGTTGMTLQQAVFAGLVDPGNLAIVREIVSTGALPADIDTAVFSGVRSDYTITVNPNGSVTVSDAATRAVDGTDTLWNIERLQFTDQTVSFVNPAPTLASINPTTTTAGSAAFTLTATGTGFASTSVVFFNGTARTTTFVSATQLTAAITAADVATAGSRNVTVVTPAPGGGTSAAVVFTVNATNPVPTIASLSQLTATARGAAFTLTINGTGFVNTSVVRINGAAAGANRATTFVSSTQLTVDITAADIATAGNIAVRVFTPAPGGGLVGPVNIVVSNPGAPAIATLNPATVAARSGAFTLTVNGSNFVTNSVVRINGVAAGANRPTTFVSSTQLTVAIPASDITAVGTVLVRVFTPTPGGGISAATSLNVVAPGAPVLTSLSPTSAAAGGAAFTLTVNGTGFVTNSVVRVNGVNRTTTFVSTTQLTAAIPAGDIAATGTRNVTVFTPTPGGGTSVIALFTVQPGAVVTTVIALPASPLDLGTKRIGSVTTKTVVVTNNGPGNLTVTAASLSGPLAVIATVDLGTCAGASVAPGRTCKLNVTFTPTSAIQRSGTLTVVSNASNNPVTMTLTATGR